MEQNFSCSKCGQQAGYFCMCDIDKINLCGLCLALHITEKGAHFTASIDASAFVNQQSDLKRYNKSLKISKNMLAAMDGVLAAVGEDEQMLAENIEIEKQKVIDSVTQTFEKLRETLAAEYQAVREIVEQGKAQIKQYEKDRGGSRGEAVEVWTSLSVHFSELQPLLLKVNEYCSQRVAIKIEETRKEVRHPVYSTLKKWENLACKCEMCASARDILNIKAQSEDIKAPEPRKEEAKEEEQQPIMPLSITVRVTEDGRRMAYVKTQEGCQFQGFICFMQEGRYFAYSPSVETFIGAQEFDTSTWAVPPGLYECCIMTEESQPLCNSFQFTENPDQQAAEGVYENCFLRASLENIAQIEAYVVEQKGANALETFKKLAAKWKHPSTDSLNPFIQALISTDLRDESTTRKVLEDQGYTF